MDFSAIVGQLNFILRLPPSTRSSSGNKQSSRAKNSARFRWKTFRFRKALRRTLSSGSNPGSKSSNADAGEHPSRNSSSSSRQVEFSVEHRPNKLPVENLVIASQLRETIPVKAVVTGIKTADLLLKGIKAVHGVLILLDAQGGSIVALGTPDGLLLGFKAAKVVFKGLKMSNKALYCGTKPSGPVQKIFYDCSKGLKASFGALNVVGGSKAIISEISSNRVVRLNWNLIVKGYEASKGALNTVEGLSSLGLSFVAAFGKGLLSFKGALGGLGLMIKAFAVSKELYGFIVKGISLSHGTREMMKIMAERQKKDSCPTHPVEFVRLSRRLKRAFYRMSSVLRSASSLAAVTGGQAALEVLCPSLQLDQEQSFARTILSVQGLGTNLLSFSSGPLGSLYKS